MDQSVRLGCSNGWFDEHSMHYMKYEKKVCLVATIQAVKVKIDIVEPNKIIYFENYYCQII